MRLRKGLPVEGGGWKDFGACRKICNTRGIPCLEIDSICSRVFCCDLEDIFIIFFFQLILPTAGSSEYHLPVAKPLLAWTEGAGIDTAWINSTSYHTRQALLLLTNMPRLKTLLRKLSLLFSLWLLWASAVISQNVTLTFDTPFTINFGNTTIATPSSTAHRDRGWGPKVFIGSEPAVFILKDGILSSGRHYFGNGPQDKSLGPKNVYWIANDKKNRPKLDLREKQSVITERNGSLVLLYGGKLASMSPVPSTKCRCTIGQKLKITTGRPTMYARGGDGRVLVDISPKGRYREGPQPTILPVK